MITRLVLLLAALMLFACQTDFEPVAPIPSDLEPAAEAEIPQHLPAYQLEWEKKVPGKADQYDDFRKMHPQWYAITEPPTPADFRPMTEWEPMQSILITFSNGLVLDPSLSATMTDIVVNSLPAGEVWVVADGAGPAQTLKIKLMVAGISDEEIEEKVKFFDIPNNAFWFIDYGPLPLVDEGTQTVAFADFMYYHYRNLDDAIPTRLANQLGGTTYRSPFPFEGGNFQADGEEYCYYGERVFALTGLSATQVEQIMQSYYGCKKSVVLKDITNDGTGHIDMFFKLGGKHVAFVGDYTVVQDAQNDQRMADNTAILEAIEYSDGSPGITVHRIPFPHPSQGIPRTFINSTLYAGADGSVKLNLWPMYTVDKDLEAEALQVWEEGLPDWEHIGIESDDISLLSGAVHCVTRTVPALPIEKWVEDGECIDSHCQGSDESYQWTCIPNSEPDPGCWGPEWKCLCNDCGSAGCSFEGSCGDGECGAGEDCFTCYKDCACPEGKNCNLATGNCDQCGDGECGDGENCADCPVDCACGTGAICSFGVCTKYPCGGIKYEGCCDGNYLVYCQGGTLYGDDCGGEGCGWEDGFYACGGAHADPSGEIKLDCHDYNYPTGCGESECGDNGGGSSCGECPGGECVEGMCEGDCEPLCTDVECGDDGCGGSCGECEADNAWCGEDGLCYLDAIPSDTFDPTDVDTGATDAAGSEDAGGAAAEEEPKKKDDGCSHSGTGNHASLVLLALLLALLMRQRRPADL